MAALINLVGMKFGRWTVTGRGESRWNCICDCGTTRSVVARDLRSGASRSCGCVKREVPGQGKHGRTDTAEHQIWSAMRARCNNPRHISYPNYGGRGIRVCAEWNDFAAFLSDMGCRPSEFHTIDRVENDGNYERSNCRWATREEQNSNRRSNKIVRYRGQSMTIAAAARLAGEKIDPAHAAERIRRGWPVEAAVEKPSKPKRAPKAYADYEASLEEQTS